MPSSLKQPWNCWKSEIPPFLFFCDVLCPPLSNKKIEFRHVPDTSRNLFQMSKRVVHRILEIVRRTKSRNPQKLDRCGRLFVCLRIEFLLKTVSGYHKDTGVTLFTLATPGNPLHYNTHWSAPPVSSLTQSRGPKRSQSPVDMLEHRDTYGQAQVCSKGHQGSSIDRPC